MKKIILILLSMALIMFAGNALAVISGAPCVDCHTMHNSQNGAPMRYDQEEAPAEALLRASSCIGCHADPFVASQINNVPQVNGDQYTVESGQGNTTAGGSFYWVSLADGDATGHNVVGFAGQDSLIGSLTPPGWDETYPAAAGINNGGATWNDQLTCAGTQGCHGDHTEADMFDAVRGAHHEASVDLDGSTVGKSYRFLLGIDGLEDEDWELTFGVNEHNVYKGVDRSGGGANSDDTISWLCAECHGRFHDQDEISTGGQMSNPWLRHPTDIDMRDLPGDVEYDLYGTNIGGYSVEAPVALSTIPTEVNDALYADEAIVTCVSCHRAHGSPFDDLLRWSYAGMEAGTDGDAVNTGCFRCHTTKDGDPTQ